MPFPVVWVPMQLGNLLVVPAAVLAALAFRRWRLAAGLALAGAGVYVLAKVVKRFVERGRPSDVLDDVVVRGAAPHGLGFVSGHIAVVTALALVAWPWLPRWGRWAAGAAVAAVFLTRMYVGAHLPLDMVGGAALGVAVGALVRLLLGVPARAPDPADDAAAAASDAEQGRLMAWLPRPGYTRHPGDALRVVLGSAVLALTTTAIHKDFIGDREAALFRVVNELSLPGWTWPGVWLVMQLGVIGAVPLVAVLALATRRLRLALDAVLAAGSIYLIAKLVKEFVQRGRPQTLLDGRQHPRGAGPRPRLCLRALGGGRGPGHRGQPVPGPAGPAGRLGPGRLRLPGPHVRRVAPAVRRGRRGRPRLGGRVAGAVRARRPRPARAPGQAAGRPDRARPRPGRPGAGRGRPAPLGLLCDRTRSGAARCSSRWCSGSGATATCCGGPGGG